MHVSVSPPSGRRRPFQATYPDNTLARTVLADALDHFRRSLSKDAHAEFGLLSGSGHVDEGQTLFEIQAAETGSPWASPLSSVGSLSLRLTALQPITNEDPELVSWPWPSTGGATTVCEIRNGELIYSCPDARKEEAQLKKQKPKWEVANTLIAGYEDRLRRMSARDRELRPDVAFNLENKLWAERKKRSDLELLIEESTVWLQQHRQRPAPTSRR